MLAKHLPLVFRMAGQNVMKPLQPTSDPSSLLTFTTGRLLHHMKSCSAQLPLQNKHPPAQLTLSETYPVDECWPQASSQFLWDCRACTQFISASCDMQVVQAANMGLMSRARGQPPAQHLRLLKRSRRSTSSTKRR